MQCLKCGSTERFKNGFYNGQQKWKCKACGHTSCRTSPRGAPVEIVRLALTLVLEGLGFNATARVITAFGYKCSENAVIGWVRKVGEKAHTLASATKPTVRYVQIDEMFSYVKKRTISDSCGWLLMAIPEEKSPHELVIALPKTLRRLMAHVPWDERTVFHTDDYSVYAKVLPQEQHRPTKQHTTTIESRNSRIRQYLARFHRKTKCYAKSDFVTEALMALLPYRKHIRTLVAS